MLPPLACKWWEQVTLLDFGERAGSGVPNILQTWDAQGWKVPEIEEQYGPDRTTLTLALTANVGRNVGRENMPSVIIDYIKLNNKITIKAIAEELGVSEKTIEREMKKMDNVKYIGRGSNGHWEIIDRK